MTADNGMKFVRINGVNLPIRSYVFDEQGTPLHVFYCYWDARSLYENTRTAEEEDWTVRGRLRAAIRGQKETGAQMLELVVWGAESDAEAAAALERQLARVIETV